MNLYWRTWREAWWMLENILYSDETKIHELGSDGVQMFGENLTRITRWYEDTWGQNVLGRFIEAPWPRIHPNTGWQDDSQSGETWGIFQHDNGPEALPDSHEFLKKKIGEDLASMSPDLHPVEHHWGVLVRKVEQLNPQQRIAQKIVWKMAEHVSRVGQHWCPPW